MPRVCVVGSANVDYALGLPRLPRAGETVLGGTLHVSLGGKGANQAVAAARLGGEVRLIACVGQDSAGAELTRGLAASGVGVDGVMEVAGAVTGTALIMVDAEGRNQIGVAPGANARLTVEMASAHAESIRWADVVVCQLETPLAVTRWALQEARRLRIITILNPAPVISLPDAVLELVDYLTPNAREADALTDLEVSDPESARRAAERLRARGAGAVVVTLGEEGAVACTASLVGHFPAFPVDAVDTTAAGDGFTGALAIGLAAGGTLEEAIPLANAAAALTCTRRGAQDALPDRAAVEQFLRKLRGSLPDTRRP